MKAKKELIALGMAAPWLVAGVFALMTFAARKKLSELEARPPERIVEKVEVPQVVYKERIVEKKVPVAIPYSVAQADNPEASKDGKPLRGKVIQVLSNGVLLEAMPAYTEQDGEKFFYPDCWKSEQWYFLYCSSKEMVDGHIYSWEIAFPSGSFKYDNVLGATKTLEALTTHEGYYRKEE